MMQFPALAHVALTVSDLPVSAAWYERLIGAKPVLDEDTGAFHHVVFAIGADMLLGLHCFPRSEPAADPSQDWFDERCLGLDHVAFACRDRTELEAWLCRLDSLDIAHGGIVDAPYGSGLSVRDPDNIALEFFAPPA